MNQISAILAELLLGAGDHAGNLGPLVGQRRHDVTFRHIHPRTQNDRADYLLQVDVMSAMRLVCMRHDTAFVLVISARSNDGIVGCAPSQSLCSALCYANLRWPMVAIGIGNGGAMAPLTTSGVRGVESRDQGAASGLVNVAYQLGGSIGFSILIVVFAANANPQLTGPAKMSHQASAVLIGPAIMNIRALILTAIFILRADRKNENQQGAVVFAVGTE